MAVIRFLDARAWSVLLDQKAQDTRLGLQQGEDLSSDRDDPRSEGDDQTRPFSNALASEGLAAPVAAAAAK